VLYYSYWDGEHKQMFADEQLVKQVYNCNTKLRGTDEEEYQIYVDCAESLEWSVKTFEEWKKS
jgi:hypothetical protein